MFHVEQFLSQKIIVDVSRETIFDKIFKKRKQVLVRIML